MAFYYHWPCIFLAALSLFISSSCSQECSAPLGMENHLIKDSQITASSQWDRNHAAIQGRLNFKAGGGKQGGWSSRHNNGNQWIQVALGSETKLTSIATQGRNAYSQWVTAYKLQYSDDGVNFHYYKVAGQSSPKVFKGNRDRDSIVYHKLNPPVQARYIRLRPTGWYRHISLRMELYGCFECSAPLGMENGRIREVQITASSEWPGNHAAIQGRLNFKAGGGKTGSWSSRHNNGNQWIQVALGSETKLTSIATQGRNAHSQWVTAYKLQYSDDGVNFHYYKVAGQSSPKVFNGNKDRDSIVYHVLNPPIQAGFIRLRPTGWHRHISLRMELYGCLRECSAPLGLENGRITDSQITASSQWPGNHPAIQGRLNFKAGGGKTGSWSSRHNNGNQWIQVALGSETKLTSIATQGRNAHSQWVTAYKLQYSDDGVNFHYYKVAGRSSPKVFNGNKDRDSIVYHKLNPPIQARYIRLRPTAWYRHISLRMELYGCLECSAPLGMENGRIRDVQITASSEWPGNHAAIQGRLNFKAGGGKTGSWSARHNNGNQWIQVALGSETKLTSIATQGRNAHSQWVTAYKLQYSDDGVNFHYYKVAGRSSPKVFNGNKDRDSIVYHVLNPPIQARFIRLRPTAWRGHISLRMELYGCLRECSAPLGMANGRIKDVQITASSQWDGNHAAIQGRLNFKAGGGKQGGWSARHNNGNQWIQVALGSETKLTSIATQGRNGANQWVTAYKLQYSDDGVNFRYYKVRGQSSPKVFNGNKNRDSIVYHTLNPPIQARYIRLRPTAWRGHISLRMELYGCLKAPGVTVHCNDKNMTIAVSKSLLRGLDPKKVRLLGTSCKGKEGRLYFTITTPLTGCNTTSRYTPSAIVYSNTLEIPVAANSVVTRVREIKVEFSCYYSTHGGVSSVGWKPSNTTIELSDKGKGNFTFSLKMFRDKRFVSPYMKDDFPVAVVLRRRLYFEVSVASNDKQLSIRADRCCATPTQDHKNPLKYEFIKKGCPNDATVKYHSAPSANAQRFSVEAFKFIAAHPFVFVHCHVIVCNATDPGSRCSMKCPSSGRGKREVSDHVTDDMYSLVQGPLHLAHGKREESRGDVLDKTGSSPSFLEALFADGVQE